MIDILNVFEHCSLVDMDTSIMLTSRGKKKLFFNVNMAETS